ncbi:hypothetical protein KFE25_002519 [Diacronema lutheri]|uniref:Uncharacterized protein n=1 Tax=Diacronema lutheri TaxID=2081491 RepID=A0A8J6C1S8_DIALT|nr:hypothetical protein KFE25_002519 [Diacronema lutheri]
MAAPRAGAALRAALVGAAVALALMVVRWAHAALREPADDEALPAGRPLRLAIAAHLWLSPCVALPANGACALHMPSATTPRPPLDRRLPSGLCGLVKWCSDASALARELPARLERLAASAPPRERARLHLPWSAHVVISTNLPAATVRAECPQDNIVFVALGEELVRLARTFSHTAFDREAALRHFQREHRGRLNELGYALGGPARAEYDAGMLLKWAFVGLTQYDLVLHTDLDVDLGLAGATDAQARVWATELPPLLESRERLIASLDGSGLINGGALLIRPSQRLYADGLALLRTNSFSPKLGFNASGRPAAIVPLGLQRAADPLNRSRSMRDSYALRADDWTFVGAAADQGLFPLVFAVRHRALRLARRADFTVHHFIGRKKPWSKRASCPAYWAGLGLIERAPAHDRVGGAPEYTLVPTERAPGPFGSACWPYLRRRAADALAALRSAERREYAAACHGKPQALL